MPHKPELQPVITKGDTDATQQTFLSIGKFLSKSPGNARVTFSAGPAFSIQCVNRVGQPNTGRWIILFFRRTAAGAITAFAPVATAGQLVATHAAPVSYLGMTDESGLLGFTCGAIAAGDTVHALVLGETSTYTAP